MLELIDKGACSPAHPTPVLFVHGAWHAAWCWDEHFLGFFADNGYRVLAVSLRGHGNSTTTKPLYRCSIADYVDDVATAVDSLPDPPVLVGHSMGGFIVQKYLEAHSVPAGVLLASSPPEGIRKATLRATREYPWLTVKSILTGETMTILNTPDRARKSMFSPTTPDPLVTEYVGRFQQESKRALYIDLSFWKLPKPELITTPMLVLGAEHDGAFTTAEVRSTAQAYHTEPELFADMGHDMMLEPGWRKVAERIHTWLTSRGL